MGLWNSVVWVGAPDPGAMPGVVSARSRNASRLVGSFSSRSRSNFASMVEVLVSTIGPSAVTVTRSSTVPTGRVRSTVKTDAAETSMFSWMTVLKASRVAVTWYLPGGRLRNTYVPLADVVADRLTARSAGLDISTAAPGRGTPSSLVTVPVTLPSRMAWARTDLTLTPTRRRERHIAVQGALPNCIAVLLLLIHLC